MNTDKEALRQQMLLRALWQDARPGVLAGWMRDGQRFARGLAAYRSNAGALAERALSAAYPVLVQLLGAESFAGMARAFWHQHAPRQGDIATWGQALAGFVAAADSLADEPYLGDVARLEWAVHQAGFAADSGTETEGLHDLANAEPGQLRVHSRPGTTLIDSSHPIVCIWQAHQGAQDAAADRFAPVREAFAQGRAETALVWRQGFRVQVAALAVGDAAFTQALLQGQSLQAAFEAVPGGVAFDFQPWLVSALQRGWLAHINATPS
jgi:Putative DNA-binding domain